MIVPSESVLSPAAESLATYYMPEYLTVVGAQYYDTTDDYWEDGSGDTVYGIYLDVEDVEVEVIAYCYNDSLVGAIYVYSIAE